MLRGTREIMYVNCLTGHVATVSTPKRVATEIISNDGFKLVSAGVVRKDLMNTVHILLDIKRWHIMGDKHVIA